MANDADILGDLAELYSDVMKDHGRNPRNHRHLENPDGQAEGFNPLCGDRITVDVKLGPAGITDVGFVGKPCNICAASASMMTQAVKGKPIEQVEKIFHSFHEMLTSDAAKPDEQTLDKLVIFAGVKKYPVRVKCATLPWHTLKAALEHRNEKVSTE